MNITNIVDRTNITDKTNITVKNRCDKPEICSDRPKICAVGLCGQSVFLTVDHFHAPEETLKADSIYSEPGGKAYNQAVAAQRLGADTVFIGSVGRDSDGVMCEEFLRREGALPLLEQSTENTAYACILTNSLGENRVTVYRGAADTLSPDFIYSCEDSIKQCDFLLLGLECPMDATLAALEIGEKYSVRTILNPAPVCPLPEGLLKRVWLITPNLHEAGALFSMEHSSDLPASSSVLPALLERVAASGLERAVVTLGSSGALVYESGQACLVHALPARGVDTTGAGDAFNGALAVRLAEGATLCEAAEFAANVSAYGVERKYVMPGLPRRDEIEKNLRRCVIETINL